MASDRDKPMAERPRFEVGTPQHLRWLHQITKTIIVLNIFDAFFTLFWVGTGFAEEANAFLRSLVNHNPIVFVLVKVALVSLGSFFLWRHRRHPLAVVGLFTVFLAYYFLLLYHLRFSNLFVRYLTDG
jgi:hypothetical protein